MGVDWSTKEDVMRGLTIGALAVMLLAQVGTDAAPQAGATLIPAERVAAAFEKGAPLVEGALYKIHASRREAPGVAEVHARDTDIIYVLDGSAVIMTGGRVVDGRTTAMDEVRGPEITGGTSQRLTKGDVFIVPNGVPHQFTEVQAPFLYYVVKATSPAGGTR
jgi:mannose-6-phosphate isomerase-like protein (cupin superfamily)